MPQHIDVPVHQGGITGRYLNPRFIFHYCASSSVLPAYKVCSTVALRGRCPATRPVFSTVADFPVRVFHLLDVLGGSLDIESYCTLRLFFVLPGRGKGD